MGGTASTPEGGPNKAATVANNVAAGAVAAAQSVLGAAALVAATQDAYRQAQNKMNTGASTTTTTGGCPCDMGYFGGDSTADATAELREYESSLAAKTKENVIRRLARGLKSSGLALDPDGDVDTIIKAMLEQIPDPRKGKSFSKDAEAQVKVCKVVAEALNNEFTPGASKPSQKLIDTTLSPAEICRSVGEWAHSFAAGVNTEFMGVHASVKNSLKSLSVLDEVMSTLFAKITAAIEREKDPELSRATDSFVETFSRAQAERRRQELVLANLLRVELAPAAEELRAAMSDLSEQRALIKKLDLRPGTSGFGDSLARAVSGLGSAAALAQRANIALKKAQISVNEYLNSADTKEFLKLTDARLESGAVAPEDLAEFLNAVKVLRSIMNSRDEQFAAALRATEGGADSDEDEFAAPRSALSKKMLKRKREIRLIHKDFAERLSRHYAELLAAITALAPMLGKEIPLSVKTDRIRDALSRVNELRSGSGGGNDYRIELSLLGRFSDADARERKERYVNLLRAVAVACTDAMADSSYSAASGAFTRLKGAIEGIEKTIDYYSDVLAKKYGGADADVMTGGADDDITEMLPTMAKGNLDLNEALNDFQYMYWVAKVRENLAQTSSELTSYGENYTELLGDAVAARLYKLQTEQDAIETRINGAAGALAAIPADDKPKVLEWLKKEYAVKTKFYKALQAVDLYMKTFTAEVAKDPAAVKHIKKMIDETQVIARWFTEKTGDLICSAFESAQGVNDRGNAYEPSTVRMEEGDQHYYQKCFATRKTLGVPHKIELDGAKRAQKFVGESYDYFQGLKNLVSAFAHIGSTFSSGSINSQVFMSPTQIYKALIDYLKQSALAVNTSERVVPVNNPVAVMVAAAGGPPAEVPVGQASFSMVGEFDRYKKENEYFVLIVKAMAAKVLTTLGLYEMFDRVVPYSESFTTRMIVGGADSDSVDVISAAAELYFRLPRLVEYYKSVLYWSGDTDQNTHTIANNAYKISMIPELEGIFSGIINIIFVKAASDGGDYSDSELRALVGEINHIWEHFNSRPGKVSPSNAALNAFVAEINRRYGLVKASDMKDYQEQLNFNRFNQRSVITNDTDYAILPGEDYPEEDITVKAPSDRFTRGRRREYDAATGLPINPRNREVYDPFLGRINLGDSDAANTRKMLEEFRVSAEKFINRKNKSNIVSYGMLIKQSETEIEKAKNKEAKLRIVFRLIQGTSGLEGNSSKLLMFHESVVMGLNTLCGVTTVLDHTSELVNVLDPIKVESAIMDTVYLDCVGLKKDNNGFTNDAPVLGDHYHNLTTGGIKVIGGNPVNEHMDNITQNLIDQVRLRDTALPADIGKYVVNGLFNGRGGIDLEIHSDDVVLAMLAATDDINRGLFMPGVVLPSDFIHPSPDKADGVDKDPLQNKVGKTIREVVMDYLAPLRGPVAVAAAGAGVLNGNLADLANINAIPEIVQIPGTPESKVLIINALRAGNAGGIVDGNVDTAIQFLERFFRVLRTCARALTNYPKLMKDHLEMVFDISTMDSGLIETQYRNGQSIQLNFTKMREFIGNTLDGIKGMFEKFRGQINKDILNRYELKDNQGSIYWLETHLVDKYLRPGAGGDKTKMLEGLSRKIDNNYVRLTRETAVDLSMLKRGTITKDMIQNAAIAGNYVIELRPANGAANRRQTDNMGRLIYMFQCSRYAYQKFNQGRGIISHGIGQNIYQLIGALVDYNLIRRPEADAMNTAWITDMGAVNPLEGGIALSLPTLAAVNDAGIVGALAAVPMFNNGNRTVNNEIKLVSVAPPLIAGTTYTAIEPKKISEIDPKMRSEWYGDTLAGIVWYTGELTIDFPAAGPTWKWTGDYGVVSDQNYNTKFATLAQPLLVTKKEQMVAGALVRGDINNKEDWSNGISTFPAENGFSAHYRGSIFPAIDLNSESLVTPHRSILFMLNQLLANYLNTFTDTAGGAKIYTQLINSIANGSVSASVNNPTDSAFPDFMDTLRIFGMRGDPIPGAVLFQSLAFIMQRLMKNVSATTQIPDHLVATLADIPLYMKEKYRCNLPSFNKLFSLLQQKCTFITNVIQKTQINTSRVNQKNIALLAQQNVKPFPQAAAVLAAGAAPGNGPMKSFYFVKKTAPGANPLIGVLYTELRGRFDPNGDDAVYNVDHAELTNGKYTGLNTDARQAPPPPPPAPGGLTNQQRQAWIVQQTANLQNAFNTTARGDVNIISYNTATSPFMKGSLAMLEKFAAGGDMKITKTALLSILDSISNVAFTVTASATEVLKELGGGTSVFYQLRDGFIETYKQRWSQTPLMPASMLLEFLGDVRHTPERTDYRMDILKLNATLGTPGFGIMYGSRGIIAENMPINYGNMPGAKMVIDTYNESTSSQYAIDPADYAKLLSNNCTLIRWLTDTRGYRPYLSRSDVLPIGKRNNEFITLIETAEAPVGIQLGLVVRADKYNTVYFLKPREGIDFAAVNAVVESGDQKDQISKILRNSLGESVTLSTRQDELQNNIIDMNIVPFNVHALMRDIPLANLYNYGYTFDRMLDQQWNDSATSSFFAKLTKNPYMDVAQEDFGLGPIGKRHAPVQRIFNGYASLGLGRPKFISDQLHNKPLFGCIYRSRGEHDESGPRLTDIQNDGVSAFAMIKLGYDIINRARNDIIAMVQPVAGAVAPLPPFNNNDSLEIIGKWIDVNYGVFTTTGRTANYPGGGGVIAPAVPKSQELENVELLLLNRNFINTVYVGLNHIHAGISVLSDNNLIKRIINYHIYLFDHLYSMMYKYSKRFQERLLVKNAQIPFILDRGDGVVAAAGPLGTSILPQLQNQIYVKNEYKTMRPVIIAHLINEIIGFTNSFPVYTDTVGVDQTGAIQNPTYAVSTHNYTQGVTLYKILTDFMGERGKIDTKNPQNLGGMDMYPNFPVPAAIGNVAADGTANTNYANIGPVAANGGIPMDAAKKAQVLAALVPYDSFGAAGGMWTVAAVAAAGQGAPAVGTMIFPANGYIVPVHTALFDTLMALPSQGFSPSNVRLSMTWLKSSPGKDDESMSVGEVFLPDGVPMALVADVGKSRFDTTYIRNLVFITDVQRILRQKMSRQLTQNRRPLLNSSYAVAMGLTEYGSDPYTPNETYESTPIGYSQRFSDRDETEY